MSSPSPTVYLLYGNDEFAIRRFLEERLKTRLGDPADTTLDITTLDGGGLDLAALQAETHSLPFLTERRMVILHHPAALAKSKTTQEALITLLESIPPSTALVLIEDQALANNHWLLKWAKSQPEKAWLQHFGLPSGGAMTHWIIEQAEQQGGIFENQAAQLLASFIDEDPRLAMGEITKLLTYADFSRPVTEEDVRLLVADTRQGDIFAMVDAIGAGDGQQAMFMMQRLLENSPPLSLFGMIIRQFRLLLQVRQLLDEDAGQDHLSIAETIGVHPYPVKKLLPQARLFKVEDLKSIYHQLSEIDLAIKTGRIQGELALEMLVASLSH